jgi:hypothetical protein
MLINNKSLSQASREYGIQGSVLSRWRKEFLERAPQGLLAQQLAAAKEVLADLAYVFPLGAPDCWFRSADLWNAFGENCTFSEGPHEYETPAGTFSDCFWIVTPYLSGNVHDWVCNGIGYVGAKYDHYGSPFGYETTLLEYKIASSE